MFLPLQLMWRVRGAQIPARVWGRTCRCDVGEKERKVMLYSTTILWKCAWPPRPQYSTPLVWFPTHSVFLQPDTVATILFLLLILVRVLFEDGIYFLGKPADINDGLIRYVRVRWWPWPDAVSSTHSLSVLLSALGTTHTCTTLIALASTSMVTIVRNYTHTRILDVATIQSHMVAKSQTLLE